MYFVLFRESDLGHGNLRQWGSSPFLFLISPFLLHPFVLQPPIRISQCVTKPVSPGHHPHQTNTIETFKAGAGVFKVSSAEIVWAYLASINESTPFYTTIKQTPSFKSISFPCPHNLLSLQTSLSPGQTNTKPIKSTNNDDITLQFLICSGKGRSDKDIGGEGGRNGG